LVARRMIVLWKSNATPSVLFSERFSIKHK
jgi:hypothetical protein